jgi:hypothetical protein
MKERFEGMMQTVWSGAGQFMDEFYGRKTDGKEEVNTASNCFKSMINEINNIEAHNMLEAHGLQPGNEMK